MSKVKIRVKGVEEYCTARGSAMLTSQGSAFKQSPMDKYFISGSANSSNAGSVRNLGKSRRDAMPRVREYFAQSSLEMSSAMFCSADPSY
jgi:hypothetical protein